MNSLEPTTGRDRCGCAATRLILAKAARALGVGLGLGVLIWGAGLVWFVLTLPTDAPSAARKTDAIIVLTGGSERFATGLQLLAEGAAPVLFVSGAGPGADVPALLHHAPPAEGGLACCIVLGHEAENTLGNASETAAFMRHRNLRSLRLVTSNYHMRRSLAELAVEMPEAEVVAHPVNPAGAALHHWYWHRSTLTLLATEYTKYLAAELHLMLARLGLFPAATLL